MSQEVDKVLFTITYLSGLAFDWFEPIVRDYQENVREHVQLSPSKRCSRHKKELLKKRKEN